MRFSNSHGNLFNEGPAQRKAIAQSMAFTFFTSAFADQYDNADEDCPNKARIGHMGGRDFADVVPIKCDLAAEHAAFTLICDMERANGVRSIEDLYYESFLASEFQASYKERTPENFGRYAAMQAMGHGIGLEEIGMRGQVKVPYLEFGMYSLDQDYFTLQYPE